MIKPRPFDILTLQKKVKQPSIPDGWRPINFGGMRGEHFISASHKATARKDHITRQECIAETEFEQYVLLTILENIESHDMTFVELGAGWGGQTNFIVTAVREQVVDMEPKSAWSLAVEAEPGHYDFLCEMFRMNKIRGLPIFGAISKEKGWAKLKAFQKSADHYGQSLKPDGNLDVPTYTLDYLMDMFEIDHVDLVHMDLQAVEPDAIRGSLKHIHQVDYLLVCPHKTEHVPIIRGLLTPTHRLCFGFGPYSGYHEMEGFPLPIYHPLDGIMVFERRGL